MSSAQLTRLRLVHVQLVQNNARDEFEEKVKQHLLATDYLRGTVDAGEKERRALEESLERHRLSKVIEALRRVNSRESFNDALDDMINRLREISEIVTSIDGVSMRNMLPVDVDAFLRELKEIHEVWQAYDEVNLEIATAHQEIKQMCGKIKELDETLRSLAVQKIIVNALPKNPAENSETSHALFEN